MAIILRIESLDHEGRGVGFIPNEDGTPGKTVFVDGGLPGETVQVATVKRKKTWETAVTQAVLKSSPFRVTPKCPAYGVCGGCSMQHLDPKAQVAVKQRVLEDALFHIGRVRPEQVMPPVYGMFWQYRCRARLSVNDVPKKGGILVGFREKKSRYVADMLSCEVMPAHISDMLVPLRRLIESLSIRQEVPQVEVCVGYEGREPVTALLLRILSPLSPEDESKLKAFADRYQIEWWTQTKGPDTVALFYPDTSRLKYTLDGFDVTMPFKPGDFTQVNLQMNTVLVTKALNLLACSANDRVCDLFCGLGNFTLALARRAKEVVGIEGSEILTQRALENAKLNGLDGKTTFIAENLFEMTPERWRELGSFTKLLLDPPRDGAAAVCETLAALHGAAETALLPERIVYVSCNPATLARDAGTLSAGGAYVLKQAGIVNMFPHTSHVESVAVFKRS